MVTKITATQIVCSDVRFRKRNLIRIGDHWSEQITLLIPVDDPLFKQYEDLELRMTLADEITELMKQFSFVLTGPANAKAAVKVIALLTDYLQSETANERPKG